MLTFILIDSRIEFKSSDKDMINWFGEKQLPFALAFTKTDKLSSNQLDSNISAIKNELIKQWDELPPMFITSSETGLGCDEIMNYIEQHNQIWMNEIEGIK